MKASPAVIDRFLSHTQTFDEAPAQVFAAVLDPRAWWGKGITGDTSQVGDEFVYEVAGTHRSLMRLTEVVPNERVVWLAVANTITFLQDQQEWDGTEVHFDISVRDDGRTELVFTHVGLSPEVECYDVCHDAWGFYVTKSLRQLVTTGTGLPNEHGEEVAAVVARMEAAG